jgi:hypothetical protein
MKFGMVLLPALALLSALHAPSAIAQSTPPDLNKGVSNAGKAKPPKGKMRIVVDGKVMEASENRVQCMLVGLGPNMAQGVITGGKAPDFNLSYTFVAAPKLGDVLEKKGSTPILGASMTMGGVGYNSIPGGSAQLKVTKMTKDGNNVYVAATFSAKLVGPDGKTIAISDGTCESGYL